MNNSITATIFIALMMTMGITTAYIFTPPSPAVIFKTTEGESEDDGQFNNVGRGRR
ncbi:MAG: hypothetical protein M3297_06665 [Thermoproteota archaeon]|jgi:hypothetical protein|nr:hypothetical protein [Thermoproteota archaeon]